MRVSGVLTPIQKFEPFVHKCTFLLSMPALSAANALSPPCCCQMIEQYACDKNVAIVRQRKSNIQTPATAIHPLMLFMSIGDAFHKLAWKRVRRYRTAVLLVINSAHGSELALVCTNGSNFRIDVKTPRKLASFVPILAYWPLRGLCSLAPSGVGFKSLYYVSQPQGRGKSS